MKWRPTLHDHPWPFVSFILRINPMPAYGAHAIVGLLRDPTWTFLIVGRRCRQWGYLEPPSVVATAAPLTIAGKSVATPVIAAPWTWTPFDVHHHAAEFAEALRKRRALRG